MSEVHLNDLDPAINAFWLAVLTKTTEFIEALRKVRLTPEEWLKQRATYRQGLAVGTFALGFAMFFLNRTCHSGILNGGMIGGKNQKGRWKMDARFNRRELETRIERIAAAKHRIHLSSRDVLDVLGDYRLSRGSLIYLNPPYYRAGKHLYLNDYGPSDHLAVRRRVDCLLCPWIVSYDDVPEIHKLYEHIPHRRLTLLHTARSAREGKEVLYFSPGLRIPKKATN